MLHKNNTKCIWIDLHKNSLNGERKCFFRLEMTEVTSTTKLSSINQLSIPEQVVNMDIMSLRLMLNIKTRQSQTCLRVSYFVVCFILSVTLCHVLILLFSDLTAGLAGAGQLGLGVPCVTGSPYTMQAAAAASPAVSPGLAAAAAAQAAPGKARSSMNLGLISGR